MKLNVLAFGLACALIWGLGVFCLTWWIIAFDGPSSDPNFVNRIYRGYTITTAGSFIGLAWAFTDALAGGVLFAWLYNMLAGKIGVRATLSSAP